MFKAGDKVKLIPSSDYEFKIWESELLPMVGIIQEIQFDLGQNKFQLKPGCQGCQKRNINCTIMIPQNWLQSADADQRVGTTCNCPIFTILASGCKNKDHI